MPYAVGSLTCFIAFCTIYEIAHLMEFSTIFFVLLFCLIAVELLFEYMRYRQLLSPKMLWIVVWQLVIVVARIEGIYQYITPWTDILNNVVLISTIVFYIVYELTCYCSSRYSLAFGSWGRKKDQVISAKKIYCLTVGLLCVGIIGFFSTVAICGYIPAFMGLIDSYRIAFRETPTMILFNSARVGCALIPFVRVNLKGRTHKIFIYSLFIIYLICAYLSGWRAYIFQGMIMYVTTEFCVSMFSKKLGYLIKRIMKYIIFIIAVFVVFSYARDLGKGNTVEGNLFEYAGKSLYMYLAPQFNNLEIAMNNYQPTNSFILSTEGIWSFFVDSSFFSDYRSVRIVMTGGYNVATYLITPYLDYGLFGIIVWTSLIAMFSATFFVSFVKKKNIILAIIMISIANTIIFTMHNGFLLSSATCYVWLVLGIIISYWCTNRRNVYTVN